MIYWLPFATLLPLLLSGLLWSGILFSHRRLLTYIATAGLLAQAWWILLTVLTHSSWFSFAMPVFLYIGGCFLPLVIGVFFWKHWHFPTILGGKSIADFFVLVALILVGGFSYGISLYNGPQADHSWVMHGFYNGDTATFVSLVQKALIGSSTNPFGVDVPLEYPTLLHQSFGSLFSYLSLGLDWIFYLPTLSLIWLIFTVPMFFLLCDELLPEFGKKKWLSHLGQAVSVLYVMALSWDAYVYPQSHFFLLGLFLLLVSIFYKAAKETSWRMYVLTVLGLGIALLLLMANAVTGTAAIACSLLFLFFVAQDKKRGVTQRILSLGFLAVMLILFFVLAPGEPQFGGLQFSYTAVSDMLMLVPVLTLVGVAGLMYLSRFSLPTFFFAGLSGLALFTFFFSNREIVIANSSRFFYHATLVAFPLALPLLVRLFYLLKRELLFATHTLVEKISGFALIIISLALLALPALGSMASATDNLVFKDEQKISSAMLEAAWLIADHTEPNAIVLANPHSPWSIPILTGRSLVRAAHEDGSAYWLSAQDDVLTTQLAAFKGDKKAQQEIVTKADYLLLQGPERLMWEPLSFEKVFDNQETVIYRLRNGI